MIVRHIISIATVAFAAVAMAVSQQAIAQEDGQMLLSYNNGDVATSSDIGMSSAGQTEAAAFIPQTMIDGYSNLKIVGMKVGLASKLNVEELTLWVRQSLDGDNLFETTLTKTSDPTVKKGWNYVDGLNWQIDSHQGLYIGYTIKQKGSCYAISANGDDCEGALFYNVGSGWADHSNDGHGSLNIGIIIEADNLPTFDLQLKPITVPSRLKIGGSEKAEFTVYNVGSRTISSFDIVCSIAGEADQTVSFNHVLKPSESCSAEMEITSTQTEKHKDVPITFTLNNLKEGNDINFDDNVWTGTLNLVKYDFQRRVMIEEFTTESCSYCPSCAMAVHEVSSRDEYADKLVIACHHSGYQTDWLTSTADKSYLWFYGGSTYAPAIMFDRCSFGGSCPVYNGTQGADAFASFIDLRLDEPAKVAVIPTATYNSATAMIDISVTGGHDGTWDDTPLMATVYLVEDSVKAKSQSNGGDDYIHMHVVRAYNSIWGDTIGFDSNDDFSYMCSLEYKKEWNKSHIYVVAMLGEYDQFDISNCTVANASLCQVAWNTDEIAPTINSNKVVATTKYYDLCGRTINGSVHQQLVIKKTIFTDGTTMSEKRYCQ